MIKLMWEGLKTLMLGLFKHRQEYFLVIEEIDHQLEATYVKVNSGDKKILIKNRKKIKDLKEIKKPLLLDKIILALDPFHATTIESLVRLKRSKPQEVINEAELDHLIFRGLWEFLNHYRGWAAKKMGVSDIDIVLANIEIRDVGLGNHRVFNPLDFKGADFFLRFRGTFIPRSFLDSISFLHKLARNIIVVEGPSIVSNSLPEFSDFVVHAGEARTCVFSLREEENLYVKECSWGFKNITESISKFFLVDEETAKLILGRFRNHRVSNKVSRIIDSLIKKEFRLLFGMLHPIYNKSRNRGYPVVHFNFRFAVTPPQALFINSSRLRLINFNKWLEIQGFSIANKKPKMFLPYIHQSTLALLTHPYTCPQYEFLNKLLRRRAKWLIGHR